MLIHAPIGNSEVQKGTEAVEVGVNVVKPVGCATWKLGAVDFLFLCYISERI
jgi:hypothetical protein